MERRSLLQSFALDKEGRLRAVDEVARGLACACACPVCGEQVIARQGQIRGWHFAHVSGADCAGAAESALHLAAKQMLVDAGGLAVPEKRLSFDVRLADGRINRGTAREAGGWIDFDSVDQEQSYLGLRPDLLAMTGQQVLFIEIAVTHFIEPEKIDRIEELAVAALEIDLASMEREQWDWATLRELVVDGEHNKQWIRPLSHERLRAKAKADAMASAGCPLPDDPVIAPATKAPRTRYFINGRILDLIEFPFGVVIWCPYDRALNERIKGLTRQLGGRWRPDRKNWLFPGASKPYLEERLRSWSGGSLGRRMWAD